MCNTKNSEQSVYVKGIKQFVDPYDSPIRYE